MEQVYHVKGKGILVVIEELKQRVKANAAKMKKYEERNNQSELRNQARCRRK